MHFVDLLRPGKMDLRYSWGEKKKWRAMNVSELAVEDSK